jgi:hypothetical protein
MFIDSMDIANRACQHLGVTRIMNPTEDSRANAEMTFAYDKLRRAELRRNNWRVAIKHAALRPIDVTTYELAPAQWNAGVQYLPGSIVSDPNGQHWISNKANNINNDPNATDIWDAYFGSLTVDVYDTSGTTAYYAGDLVYIQNADSSFTIFLSRVNSNTDVPNVAAAWNATTTYSQDQTVTYSGVQWRSLIALNTNNIPAGGPANWVASQTYTIGTPVTGTDGFIYTSVGNGNIGNNPVTDGGTNWTNTDVPNAWAANPILPVSATSWTPIYAGMNSFNIVYPLGFGPSSQALTKNIFRLPAGFLRPCPQNPKAGVYSFLGAPVYNGQDDWLFEGKFLLSEVGTPIILRFIADLTKVRDMDDLLCECIAARMALETCEILTNSNAKQQTCNNAYIKFRGEAITVNGIEVGPTEPPEDDYIQCRL